jgi:hypothetical protein
MNTASSADDREHLRSLPQSASAVQAWPRFELTLPEDDEATEELDDELEWLDEAVPLALEADVASVVESFELLQPANAARPMPAATNNRK